MTSTELITETRIPFTEEDERRIASAGLWGMVVAVTSIAGGLIALVVQISAASRLADPAELFGSMIQAAFAVLINAWLLQASQAMRKVALTDEADQAHLLLAFRKLRAYFMVQVILMLVAIGFGILVALTIT